MKKLVDLTNQRFGMLIALKRVQSKNGHTYWLCQCDCGNQKEIQTSHLTCGTVQSCGCQKVKNFNKTFSPTEQECPICGRNFLNRHSNRHYCYECIPESVPPDRRQYYKNKAFKHFLVMYKGGKCERCGYHKYEGALEFHHKNPAEKDLELSKWRLNYTVNRQIFLDEVDKCILLCANCHREEHAKLNGEQIK